MVDSSLNYRELRVHQLHHELVFLRLPNVMYNKELQLTMPDYTIATRITGNDKLNNRALSFKCCIYVHYRSKQEKDITKSYDDFNADNFFLNCDRCNFFNIYNSLKIKETFQAHST